MRRSLAAAMLTGVALTTLPAAPASAVICHLPYCPTIVHPCEMVRSCEPPIERQCFDTGDFRFCIPS